MNLPLALIALGKPQKKEVIFLMAGPLRPNPSPSPRAQWPLKFWNDGKKVQIFFLLMSRPFTPPSLLIARPLREELFLWLPL